MPELNSPIHLHMLQGFRSARTIPRRIVRAIRNEIRDGGTYGSQWGDPETWAPLKFVRDRYVLPYVKPDHIAIEIGPGGGRPQHVV
jgi:hypothetical protein